MYTVSKNKETVTNFLSLIDTETSSKFKYEEGKLYTFVNPYSYISGRDNIDTYKEFKHIYIDGIFVCLVFKFFNIVNPERLSFDMTSVAPIVLKKAEDEGLTLCIVGTKPGVIEEAIQNIKLSYPKLNIQLVRNGYFKDQQEKETFFDTVVSHQPDIVIVGMGAPLQEKFLLDLKDRGWNGTGFTCGGFLHQTSGGINYYPKWVDLLHLRWVYRIYTEPKLFRRYTVDYMKFIFLFLKDYIKFKSK